MTNVKITVELEGVNENEEDESVFFERPSFSDGTYIRINGVDVDIHEVEKALEVLKAKKEVQYVPYPYQVPYNPYYPTYYSPVTIDTTKVFSCGGLDAKNLSNAVAFELNQDVK